MLKTEKLNLKFTLYFHFAAPVKIMKNFPKQISYFLFVLMPSLSLSLRDQMRRYKWYLSDIAVGVWGGEENFQEKNTFLTGICRLVAGKRQMVFTDGIISFILLFFAFPAHPIIGPFRNTPGITIYFPKFKKYQIKIKICIILMK